LQNACKSDRFVFLTGYTSFVNAWLVPEPCYAAGGGSSSVGNEQAFVYNGKRMPRYMAPGQATARALVGVLAAKLETEAQRWRAV
jgi:hypothetical protein